MNNSRRRLLYEIVDVVVDNAALILTIGFAGFVIYRHDIAKEDVSVEQLLTAILWVIGLFAISEIVERYRKLNAIQKSVDRSVSFLESRLADRPSAIAFFQKQPEISRFIQRANQIDLCGVTLTTTLGKSYGNLRSRLGEGAKIRVMLIDVESTALEMSAQRSSNPKDLDYYRTHIDSSLRELAYLYKSLQENRTSKKSNIGSITVKLLSYAPSFGMINIDPDQRDGVVFVEIYPHKLGYETPPTFDLTQERDQDWYNYFVRQFDQMWNVAKLWDPDKYLETIPFPKDE